MNARIPGRGICPTISQLDGVGGRLIFQGWVFCLSCLEEPALEENLHKVQEEVDIKIGTVMEWWDKMQDTQVNSNFR